MVGASETTRENSEDNGVSQPVRTSTVHRGLLWILASGAFVVAVALVVNVVVGNYTTDLTAPGGSFWDFRDAGYYPVRAALDGIVPYDVARYLTEYPVGQEFPLLPPVYMVLHAPAQLLSVGSASLAMFGLNIIGIVALSAWSLRLARYRVDPPTLVAVSTLVIVSNGGRNVLFSGQASLVFVAGVYLALTASGFGWGTAGVFIALIKPGFGVPLTLLVAAAGKYRRAAAGALVAAAVSAFLMVPFISRAGGLGPLIDILIDNLGYSAASPWVSLETTTARIDVAATIAIIFDVVPPSMVEILLGVAVVAGSAFVLFARRTSFTRRHYADAAIVLVCLATLTGIYHSFYDLVILVLPAILLTRRDFAGARPSRTLRMATLAAVLLAGFNPFRVSALAEYLPGSSRMAEVLGTGLTGASLLVALVLAVVMVWQLPAEVSNHFGGAESR